MATAIWNSITNAANESRRFPISHTPTGSVVRVQDRGGDDKCGFRAPGVCACTGWRSLGGTITAITIAVLQIRCPRARKGPRAARARSRTVVIHRINCRPDTLAAAAMRQPVKTWAINSGRRSWGMRARNSRRKITMANHELYRCGIINNTRGHTRACICVCACACVRVCVSAGARQRYDGWAKWRWYDEGTRTPSRNNYRTVLARLYPVQICYVFARRCYVSTCTFIYVCVYRVNEMRAGPVLANGDGDGGVTNLPITFKDIILQH